MPLPSPSLKSVAIKVAVKGGIAQAKPLVPQCRDHCAIM